MDDNIVGKGPSGPNHQPETIGDLATSMEETAIDLLTRVWRGGKFGPFAISCNAELAQVRALLAIARDLRALDPAAHLPIC